MASSPSKLRNWSGTLSKMSKTDVYFERTLDAKDGISAKKQVRCFERKNARTFK